MPFDAGKAKNGDRVRDKSTGDEFLLQGGQWIPVQVTATSAGAINFFDKGVQNALNTPAAIEGGIDAAGVNLAALGMASAGSVGNLLQGQPAGFSQQFSDSKEKAGAVESQTIPRFGDIRNFGEDLRALALGGDQRDKTDQSKELFPRASAVGEFGADAAALLAARRPIAKSRSNIARENIKSAEEFLTNFRSTKRMLDPKQQAALDDVATKAFKKLKGGAQNLQSLGVKVSEASLEGAYLAALNDDDPVVSAAVSAGTQAAGSLGLFLSTNPRTALMATVGGTFAIHELWKTFAPGDQNFFESKDFAFQSAAAALTLGLLGSVTGAGRLGPTAAKFPLLGDAITAVPRAIAENRFRELRDNSKEGNFIPERVMERMSINPTFFNRNQLNSLARAMNSKRSGAFTKEIERLMVDSPDFRDRVNQLNEQRVPPENTEFSGALKPERVLSLATPTNPIQRFGQ